MLPDLSPGVLLAGAVTAAAASLWLLLPRGAESRAARWLGLVLGAVALAGLVAAGRRLGSLGEEGVFLTVALVAVVSGAATIVTRSPVYSAIWFALSLAGVAGVLLVLGAQFLGVATIVVYAGAILVMFLFVLMLAQPSGLASYDRVSNEPLLSAVAGAVLLGLLSLSIGRLSSDASCCAPPTRAAAVVTAAGNAVSPGSRRGLSEDTMKPGAGATGTTAQPMKPGAEATGTTAQPMKPGAEATGSAQAAAGDAADPLAVDQVARLGGELFGRHLLAVEAAGVLLLAALIGAIAIVARGEAALEDDRRLAAEGSRR
jgi:NADH-quinone oxidoreductase subunit J